jgi:DnaJ-class molecular chaperone
MKKYQQINEARMVLELPEQATMEQIKSNFRNLIRKWHPDRCRENKKKCREMTTRIIDAYRVINDYCKNYKFSFSEQEVKNYISAEEWWFERFGMNSLYNDEQK